MTFRAYDATTGEPLRNLRVTRARLRTVTRWTLPFTMTTKSASVDEGTLAPSGADARVTVSVGPALEHNLTFTCDGYYQVRVQVQRGVSGEVPRILVEPVVFNPREPYVAPPADVIEIPLDPIHPPGSAISQCNEVPCASRISDPPTEPLYDFFEPGSVDARRQVPALVKIGNHGSS